MILLSSKLDISPFVVAAAPQQSSRKTPAGTLKIKPIKISRDICKSNLQEKGFPAIFPKFVAQENVPVLVQQDNASPHLAPYDSRTLNAGLPSNISSPVKIVCQPANLPDLNA